MVFCLIQTSKGNHVNNGCVVCSQVQATISAALLVGWSVYWLVHVSAGPSNGWSVCWSIIWQMIASTQLLAIGLVYQLCTVSMQTFIMADKQLQLSLKKSHDLPYHGLFICLLYWHAIKQGQLPLVACSEQSADQPTERWTNGLKKRIIESHARNKKMPNVVKIMNCILCIFVFLTN